jgi:4-hydroxyphenylpyruvate dioxygenase
MADETNTNPIGLNGIDFVEFTSKESEKLHQLFTHFGFSRLMAHPEKELSYYRQHDIHFLLNNQPSSFAESFATLHGPSICSMGWRVKDAKAALELALERGAEKCEEGDFDLPAIWGIGRSVIYFVDNYEDESRWSTLGLQALEQVDRVEEKGFLAIDHLTNNVKKGTMQQWADFYKNIFGFQEVRYFDIRGVKTGLTSYALQSPCKSFCIPINEATEKKSQINEYLEEYNGPGIQHIAFLTDDILNSLDKMEGSGIETLDIDDEYYSEVYDRVPNVVEDKARIRHHNVLVDGDDDGYLLQIFTKNVVGPIFIEIIQRKNHNSFGEGNFGALFRSIERDQEKRGYL